MAEPKSQDKFFQYNLKQEGFESFNWPTMENEFDEFKNSNSFLIGKMNNRSQLFGEFNPLSINPDTNNDPGTIPNPIETQNPMGDPNDQSGRVNSNFPLFNEKLLATGNPSGEVGINALKPPYSSLMINSMNMSKFQNYPMANNYYFPLNVKK